MSYREENQKMMTERLRQRAYDKREPFSYYKFSTILGINVMKIEDRGLYEEGKRISDKMALEDFLNTLGEDDTDFFKSPW